METAVRNALYHIRERAQRRADSTSHLLFSNHHHTTTTIATATTTPTYSSPPSSASQQHETYNTNNNPHIPYLPSPTTTTNTTTTTNNNNVSQPNRQPQPQPVTTTTTTTKAQNNNNSNGNDAAVPLPTTTTATATNDASGTTATSMVLDEILSTKELEWKARRARMADYAARLQSTTVKETPLTSDHSQPHSIISLPLHPSTNTLASSTTITNTNNHHHHTPLIPATKYDNRLLSPAIDVRKTVEGSAFNMFRPNTNPDQAKHDGPIIDLANPILSYTTTTPMEEEDDKDEEGVVVKGKTDTNDNDNNINRDGHMSRSGGTGKCLDNRRAWDARNVYAYNVTHVYTNMHIKCKHVCYSQ